MRKDKQHNDASDHNAAVTGRPSIFFPAAPGESAEYVSGRRVKEFTANYVTPGMPEYLEMKKLTTERDRNRLRALRLLRYTNMENDAIAARKALTDGLRLLDDGLDELDLDGTKEPGRVARVLYSVYLTKELQSVRLVIHRTKRGEFVPAIVCPDMKTALSAFAAYRGVEACMNCQTLFAVDATRPDNSSSERYCTSACGQRYRQKLYRLRQKSRVKKVLGRKAGKR